MDDNSDSDNDDHDDHDDKELQPAFYIINYMINL